MEECDYCRNLSQFAKTWFLAKEHCPQCHEFPCEWCSSCPCYPTLHHPDCERIQDEHRANQARYADDYPV